VAQADDGFQVLAATIDPTVPWGGPVLVDGSPVAPPWATFTRAHGLREHVDAGPRVILGPGQGPVTASIFSAGRWQRAGALELSAPDQRTVVAPSGAREMVLNDVALSDGVAYRARYRLQAGGARTYLHTGPEPAALLRAGWRFARSVTPRLRAALRAVVRGANPQARRLIGRIDGLATLAVSPAARASVASLSDMTVHYRRAHLTGDPGVRRLIVLHEIGHLVDVALVDPGTRRALDRMVPAGNPCARHAGPRGEAGCEPTAERFADTFAKWAAGTTFAGVPAGYAIRAPRSLGRWGRMLIRGVHLRPRGPRHHG
jgi:hypothetical protein